MRAMTLCDGVLDLNSSFPQPQAVEGEALLKLRLAGICRTDLELVEGYYPFAGTLGHEFVADVVEGSERFRGRRVVGEINASCHQCEVCRAGQPLHCPHRTVLGIVGRDGCFSDYFRLPELNLHIVPDHVHILAGGKIRKSGGKELALQVEETGYAGIDDAA